MVDGLVSGKLYGTATSRTSQNGKQFVTAKVRAAVGDGEALFVNVIAFSTTAGEALLALADGDSVALAGTLTPKAYTATAGTNKVFAECVGGGGGGAGTPATNSTTVAVGGGGASGSYARAYLTSG